MSNSRARQIVTALTVLVFVIGYLLIVRLGVSDFRHILGLLAASYLILWGGYSLLSSLDKEEIRARFVLMTLTLALLLFFAELPAWSKIIDYRQVFSVSSDLLWEQPGYQLDSELLAKPKSHHVVNMRFSRGNIGDALCLPPRHAESFELKYDRNGFRNDQDIESAEIVVIGDSYVESQMFPTPVLSTTRLASTTQKTVANLGQSGYGPQQELAVLKRYALRLHPEVVVWVFYEGNDLLDAQHYQEMSNLVRHKLESWEMIGNRSFLKNSLLWVMNLTRGCTPAPTLPAVPATFVDKKGSEHQLYVKGRSKTVSLTKQDLAALQKSVAMIEEAYWSVQNEGARFIVAFAPTAFRVYDDIANFEKPGEANSPPWVLDDLPDRFGTMVSNIAPNIRYLDLTRALKEAARDNPVFLSDDTHWSIEGHQVVADAVAAALNGEAAMLPQDQYQQ